MNSTRGVRGRERPVSIFEVLMLICFGASWPFSIHKSWVSGKTGGKSVQFLILIVIGYVFGIIHKILYKPDPVVFLYGLNALMVSLDIALFYRNRKLERQQGAEQ